MQTFDYEAECEAGIKRVLKRYVYDPALKLSEEEQSAAEAYLREIVDEYGPVVSDYPTWHPFVRHLGNEFSDPFPGLDHPICFVNAILSTPYSVAEAEETVAAVNRIGENLPDAYLSAELADVTFYSRAVFPLLVRCEWKDDAEGYTTGYEGDAQIPKYLVLRAMLRQHLKNAERCRVGETWQTMVPYLLGSPSSDEESFFVSAETGRAMREVWDVLNRHRVFGPVFE